MLVYPESQTLGSAGVGVGVGVGVGADDCAGRGGCGGRWGLGDGLGLGLGGGAGAGGSWGRLGCGGDGRGEVVITLVMTERVGSLGRVDGGEDEGGGLGSPLLLEGADDEGEEEEVLTGGFGTAGCSLTGTGVGEGVPLAGSLGLSEETSALDTG